MRKLLSPLLLAGAMAALNVGSVGAELEYCMVDPAVTVDHTTVEVGVYTTDEALLSDVTGPIQITLRGVPGASISTNPADWNRGRYPVQVAVAGNLSGHASAKREPFTVDAVVPSTNSHAHYFIKVTLPDGHVYEGVGRTNAVNELRVEVPQQAASGDASPSRHP